MTYDGTKVLITGADGFIGSHLTEALLAQFAQVTALSLYNSYDSNGWLDDIPDEARSRLKLVRGDRATPPSYAVLCGTKRSSFISERSSRSLNPMRQLIHTSRRNVGGTLNVLEAAREFGVRRVIHTSTSEVYGTAITMPINESRSSTGSVAHSASKIGADMMSEAFARSFDLPVAILRPFNTFGPRQSERAIIPTIIRQALDRNCVEIRVGDTSPVRDLTFVEDTVAAFLAVG